jgi:hypothetical protein
MPIVTEDSQPNPLRAPWWMLGLALGAIGQLSSSVASSSNRTALQKPEKRSIYLAGVKPFEDSSLDVELERTVMLPDGRFVHVAADPRFQAPLNVTLLDRGGKKPLARLDVEGNEDKNVVECLQEGQDLYTLTGSWRSSLVLGKVSIRANKLTYLPLQREIQLPAETGPFGTRLALVRARGALGIGVFDHPEREGVARPRFYAREDYTTRFRWFGISPLGVEPSKPVAVYPTAAGPGQVSVGDRFLAVSDLLNTRSSIRIIDVSSRPTVSPLQEIERVAPSKRQSGTADCPLVFRQGREDSARVILVDRRGAWTSLGTLPVGTAAVWLSPQRLSDSRFVVFTRTVVSERDSAEDQEVGSMIGLFTWCSPTAWCFRTASP